MKLNAFRQYQRNHKINKFEDLLQFFDKNEIFKSIVDIEFSTKDIPNKFCVLDEKAYYGKCAKCGKIVKYSSKHRYRIWSDKVFKCGKCSKLENISKALSSNKIYWDSSNEFYYTEKAERYRTQFINSGIKNRIGNDGPKPGSGVIYTRDQNGHITFIDGVPINEKYKIIENVSTIKEGFLFLTGRKADSKNWKAKEAFDQSLVDNNIGWFVYIKFYINHLGESKPIVVGKSGTKLVSNSINDIVFNYWEINQGPARQYLKENNLDWDKTKVLIIPCDSEPSAYQKEKEIHDLYGFFYS